MELNIIPISSNPRVPRRPPPHHKPTKGSWRKRRRDQVIQRARAQKRLRPSKPERQKSAALAIQNDEFASGIDDKTNNPIQNTLNEPRNDTARPRSTGAKVTEPRHGTARDRNAGDNVSDAVAAPLSARGALRKGTNGNKGDAVRSEAVQDRKRKAGRPRVEPVPVDRRDDQKPEAVSAALAVIGQRVVGIGTGDEAEDLGVEKGGVGDGGEEGGMRKGEMFGASSFEDTGLYRSVARHAMYRMGMRVPTRVQEKVLSVMLNLKEGQHAVDVLIRSATGSGKTLAYLLPIAHYLLNRARRITREDGALAVVVVPTRELAEQVEGVAEQLFRPWHWIVTGSVRGGESKHREKARLRKGISVLVATPGRLLDHMRNTRSFTYELCEFLVLDEADRLLDLGFEGEIREVIENLNNQAKVRNPGGGKTRSNLLLSATLRADVDELAKFSLEKPVEIKVGETKGKSKSSFAMPHLLRQHYCIVDQRHRLVTLTCFLRLRALKDTSAGQAAPGETGGPSCKIIVFFSTCDSVDFHYEILRKAKVPKELKKRPAEEESAEKMIPLEIFRIHGSHTQGDRVEALRGFRKSRRAVLLCTDVAARGLDLKGLTFSIQFDPPTGGQGEELEYLHRAGRTARIGEQGDALLFLLPSERAYIGKLESKGVSISEISGSAAIAALYPKVDLTKQESISYGTRLVTSALQESFDGLVKENEELRQLAVAGFQAYCRAYATHAREVRYFFHVRNLHLGHVARAFVLGDKPGEMSQMMAEIKAAKAANSADDDGNGRNRARDTKKKGDIARAIAEGERQPYNDQSTELARRRREKGRGQEAYRELAMEFGS